MAVKTIDLGPVSSYAIAVAHGYTGTEAEWYALINDTTTKAAEAAQSATNAARSATSAQNTLTDVVNAGTRAVRAIQDEETTQAAAIAAAGAAQISDITDAKTAAVNAVTAQQNLSTQAVYDKGLEEIAAVEAKGDEVIESIPQDYDHTLIQTKDLQVTKQNVVGSYTRVTLEKQDGMWNFDTDSADSHSSRKYVVYTIPSGTTMLGIRGFQFSADNAAFGFYDGNGDLIYASWYATDTDMSNATPIAIPTGAATLYVNIGTGDSRGVWTFVAADVKNASEQGVRMSNVTINNLTQLISAIPETAETPTKADFDNAINGWVYLIAWTPSVVEFASILNMPVRAPGVLMTLSKNATYDLGKAQIYYATNGSVFVRTRLSSGWREWTQLSPAVYYVGATRAETSLIALLKRVQTDTTEKIIYIDPGTYDIFADYQANNVPIPPDNVATDDFVSYNVFVPMHTKLIGIGDVTLTFTPSSSEINAATSKTWSPLNLRYGFNTIENICLHVKNCRYAIHDDSNGDFTHFKNVYSNVRIIAEANDTGLGFAAATGFGFADYSTFIFEDCDFQLAMSGAALYGHEGGHGAAQIIVRNCVFKSLNSTDATVRFQNIRKQSNLVAPCNTRIEGCYIGGKISLQSKNNDSGQFFAVTLLKSGNPPQIIDDADNPYPITVYE